RDRDGASDWRERALPLFAEGPWRARLELQPSRDAALRAGQVAGRPVIRRLAIALVTACAAFTSHADQPVQLALIEGLSGPFGNTGEAAFRNLQWAAERINARRGAGACTWTRACDPRELRQTRTDTTRTVVRG